MKIQVKDLRPNPYRNIGEYPISEDKIKLLVASIRDTTFWDNILARKNNGYVEIAYGHARLASLQREESGYGMNAEVDIPVKILSDEMMIKIMANENMNDYDSIPSIINETIRCVRDFLLKNKEIVATLIDKRSNLYQSNSAIKKMGKNIDEGIIGATLISRFLGGSEAGWGETKISTALRELGLIEEKILDKDAINMLPDQTRSREFTKIISDMQKMRVLLSHPKSKEQYLKA